ncbi:MAG: hypothetical protein GF317_12495 [Candidatus Lokiarchaeota archaeon]|nr:hypothetical protein [Candidatus Lokiarchaeota archaeon]MBD3200466.1 hypothetical protein [Candidatus Lokiarchaeota archaeon]
MDNRTYLTYLLPALNVKELKQICRDFKIKGYSRLKKAELIEFILDSLAEEEMKDLIKQREMDIISQEINDAFNIINGKDRETIAKINVVNPDLNEIELMFKGFNWNVGSFISITENNIKNPDRDCDCRVGSNMGFCKHFWVGFIFSLKNNFFELSDWTLTPLPDGFKDKLDSLQIKESQDVGKKEDDDDDEEMILINKDSDQALLMANLNSRITIYEGEVEEIEKRKSEFQDHETTYYMVILKNVKFGPQIKRKSDYDEDKIQIIDNLRVRLSELKYEKAKPEKGDKLTLNGTVDKDNFWGYMIKRSTKVKTL